MVLKPEPLFRALDAIAARSGSDANRAGGTDGRNASAAPHVVLTSPQGEPFTQETARILSGKAHVVVLCGRYEGVDERVRARVDQEISIGDYVLSGGELPALVIVDAVARLVPGVVGDEQSVVDESFTRGVLDFPHYTRPAEFGEARVPDVLLSGNHADIRRWRKRAAIRRTFERRPELLEGATLDEEERDIWRELVAERDERRRALKSVHRREMAMSAIELFEKTQLAERPTMKSGDTVRVHVKVREGDKERIQIFEGIVIGLHRGGTRASFTVRKVSFGQGVERIFPLHSPTIQKVEVMRSAKVRRAKLYYLRELKGKAARMKDNQ